MLGIGAVAFTVLWWRYRGGGPGVELDAIRTAGALMAGAGGAIALLLAARRQRSTELTLEHQREVARATERDAAEQRITELYTRAIEQLGAEKAPVRLGALHALEHLAQNNPAQRQTIVDVICAYLRMPYTPPNDQAPGEDAPEEVHHRHEQRRQELQVRLTAQRILTAHLKPEAAAVFWADIDLNLTEAHLHQLDLTTCQVKMARFDGAMFTGNAGFSRAKFAGTAGFGEAKFAGDAWFGGAEFAGHVWFDEAEFAGDAVFGEARLAGYAGFGEAEFAGTAVFDGAEFAGTAVFDGAEFAGTAWFDKAKFAGNARFSEAKFAGDARFDGAEFAGNVWFGGAQFAGTSVFDGARVASRSPHAVLPMRWTTRAAQPAEEEASWLYVVRDEDSIEQPAQAPGDPPSETQ